MINVFITVFKKIRNNRKGMETVEMAINLPILLYIVFSCIIFLSIYAKIIVIDAAREGARAAAITTTDVLRDDNAEIKVREVIRAGGLNENNIESIVVDTDSLPDAVWVGVVYRQPTYAPGLPMLVGGNLWDDYFRLSSSSVFKKETE